MNIDVNLWMISNKRVSIESWLRVFENSLNLKELQDINADYKFERELIDNIRKDCEVIKEYLNRYCETINNK